jgi:hypothetical protein
VATSAQGNGPVQAVQAQQFEGGVHRVRANATGFDRESGQFTWDYTAVGRAQSKATGLTQPTLSTPGQQKAQVNCFSNTVTNGFFSVPTTGAEWMDWGVKDAQKTGIVGRFALAYATNARGVSESGGTGATLGLSFYSGTTGFCSRGTRATFPGGPLGGQDVSLGFGGLPGATGSQVSPGFSITFTLLDNSVFCLPDGKVGWGYIGLEPPMGTNQNATGPLLSDFSTNTCWNDAFDLWSRPDDFGTCAGVFFFGGCVPPVVFAVGPPCAGFWIQIWEEEVSLGVAVPVDNGPNPNNYIINNTATIGGTLSISTVVTAGNIAGVLRGKVGTLFAPGVALGFMVAPTRWMLIPGSSFAAGTAGGLGLKTFNVPIPKDLSLIGLPLGFQSFGLRLSPFMLEGFDGANYVVGAE